MSRQINLFNPIFLQQKKIFAARTMAQALGLVAAGGLVIAGAAWHSVGQLRQAAAEVTLQAAKKQARLASATTDFAPRKPDAALSSAATDAETQLAALRRVAQLIHDGDLGNARGYAEDFRALGRQHQDGLWLTGVAIGQGAAMSLQGRALSATLVPGYIARLTREPVLRGKAFGNLQISQPAPGPVAGSATGSAAGSAPAAPLPFIEFSLQANAVEVKP